MNAPTLVHSRRGRWVDLVPVQDSDLPFLYDLAIDDEVGYRWRYLGAVPAFDAFCQGLWTGVLTQLVMVEKNSRQQVGLVVCYNADLHHGFAYIGGIASPALVSTGLAIEGFDLFIGHLFASYALRKLYFEVPEYNLPFMDSVIGWLLKTEGIMKSHTFHADRYWDRHVLALYREDFTTLPKTSAIRRRWAMSRG